MNLHRITSETDGDLKTLVNQYQATVKTPTVVYDVHQFIDSQYKIRREKRLGTCAMTEGDYLAVVAFDERTELFTSHIDLPTDGLASIRGAQEIALEKQSKLDADLGITSARTLTEQEGQALVTDLQTIMLFTEFCNKF